jgi:uncharacterized phage protein (TIGR02220 family)
MRIRTVKPEFWQHELMSALPPFTRLLALALLNYADDAGYFNCNPALIRGNLFPFQEDSKNILVSIQELSRIGYLEVLALEDGREVGKIINFRKHQRIDKPQKSKLEELVKNSKNIPRTFQESSNSVPGGNGTGKGSGNGKESIVELELKSEPDQIPENDIAKARILIAFLNETAGRQYHECASHLKPIMCRLKEVNGDVDGIKAMITRQVKRWGTDEKMMEYLRPQTLFNATKFHEYYANRTMPVHEQTAPNRANRNIGTLNEGLENQYANVGKVVKT